MLTSFLIFKEAINAMHFLHLYHKYIHILINVIMRLSLKYSVLTFLGAPKCLKT